jgi:deazaflavin-dependent oxidoreductase (nitroreductase family)
VNPGRHALSDVDSAPWDVEVVRALLARLYAQHEHGDAIECHATVTALNEHLHLVRLIVPQHQLWTINPYRRCDFRCTYCSVYAQGAASPVLTGAALRHRLRQELEIVPPDHHTALSSMCDAYVSGEAELGVARVAIEELLGAGRCVHVVTKGTTVLRDADLIRRARCGKVEVSLSTLDERCAATLEPGAPTPRARLELVRALAAAGVDVGIMVAPWIPDVTDVGGIEAAAGSGRRITISPLKCNAAGAQLTLAGRTYTQQVVNRRYREERERFRDHRFLLWEAPWRFDDHYSSRYLPLTFEEADGIVRSPEPVPDRTQRMLRLLATHGGWKRLGRIHASVYRASRGRAGGTLKGVTYLLLTTRGRRSGRPRVVALPYVEDGARWVVVAANGGADCHPAWLLNLRAGQDAVLQIGGTRVAVTASEASGQERFRLWATLQAAHRLARRFGQMTPRALPVVVLRRR